MQGGIKVFSIVRQKELWKTDMLGEGYEQRGSRRGWEGGKVLHSYLGTESGPVRRSVAEEQPVIS